jgi:hypothetical protein
VSLSFFYYSQFTNEYKALYKNCVIECPDPHFRFVCHSTRKLLIDFIIFIFCRQSNGTKKHLRKHRCTPETKCPNENEPDAWTTSDKKYIKFAARVPPPPQASVVSLVSSPGPNDLTLASPKASTSRLPPASEVLGVPISSSPVALGSHLPQSFLHPPSEPSPIASGSHLPQSFLHPPSEPSLIITSSPDPTSSPTQEDLDYLKDLKFMVNNNGPFSWIWGFFPNLLQYSKNTNKETLTVYFVLSPKYKYDPNKTLAGDFYCSEEEIDRGDFFKIQNVSSTHIYLPSVKANSRKNKKVTCRYNSWVSLISSIFFIYLPY